MRKGIAVAGNMVVDTIYPIEHYPKSGDLTSIEDNITKATGGAVCNVIIDLAKLDETLPLTALGVIGNDDNGRFIEENLSNYKHIDLSQIAHDGTTSFTVVMSDKTSKQRTFFHYRGANANFAEKHIDLDHLDIDLLHIGYILLLDELDKPDKEYGTKMARLLASAQRRGIKTSIDVVSGSEEFFKTIVPPSLKHTNYCIINEIEAERTTGITLRDGSGMIDENIALALTALKNMGVLEWVVIHAPEGGYGLNCQTGEIVLKQSLCLPEGYIKGANGAGDAFCSGVLYGAYFEKSLSEAIEVGIACAACSLSEPGASEGMRNYGEVMQLYEKMK
ncbi:carbohydrate kinase pfkb [Lucifera butyrica]|uniref:Carbohydrate kinase pfkb n=1 Tax=Lucifera butyrica TaxID=1351585 RepID=A0A498R292_9FIRM|nr:carbohydrate kinase family protein [Lucifera butyrica]VBB04937.1 carbohydrate kinase pfkb [Lucifera butyrica]